MKTVPEFIDEIRPQDMPTITIKPIGHKSPSIKRKCGDCTACCEWVRGYVNGREFYPGKKCHYLGCNRCSIYENRPSDPCVDFNCEWLLDDGTVYPEWMHPLLSKAMVLKKSWANNTKGYLLVIECGEKMDRDIYEWIVTELYLHRDIPIVIQNMYGKTTRYGNKEFIEADLNNA